MVGQFSLDRSDGDEDGGKSEIDHQEAPEDDHGHIVFTATLWSVAKS